MTKKSTIGAAGILTALSLGTLVFLTYRWNKTRRRKETPQEAAIQNAALRILSTAFHNGEKDLEINREETLFRQTKIRLLHEEIPHTAIISWFKTQANMDPYIKGTYTSGTLNFSHKGKLFFLRLAFTPDGEDQQLFIRALEHA